MRVILTQNNVEHIIEDDNAMVIVPQTKSVEFIEKLDLIQKVNTGVFNSDSKIQLSNDGAIVQIKQVEF